MSDSDLTAVFYGASEAAAATAVEVPMKDSEDVVTVDFLSEVPDAEDITGFLTNEEAGVQYWLGIAACYAARGLLDQSSEIVRNALSYFKDTPINTQRIHVFLAWLAIKQAREATTEDTKRGALLQARESVKYGTLGDPLLSLASAEMLFMEKRDQEAIRAIDSLSNYASNSSIPAYGELIKAKISFRRGRFHDALKHFQAVLIDKPLLKPDPRIGIGLCFWALNDRKLAVQAWKRAIQLDEKNTVAELLIALSKFDTAFKSLGDKEFTEQYSGALVSLKELLKKNPNAGAALLMKASFHFSRGELDTVKDIASKVLSQSHNSPVVSSDANFWLGRVAYNQENFVEAQKHYKDATDLNPRSVIAHLGYAQAVASRGEAQNAIFSLEALVKKNNKISEIHYALGMLYAERFETSGEAEDSQRAIASLQEYIKVATQKSESVAVTAYLTLSRFYETSDNIEALKYLNRAVEAFTSHGEQAPAELISNMGVLHFVQGSQDSAQTLFESAIAANENDELDITLNYNLARSEENGNLEKSLEKYAEILAKVPGYVSAQMRTLFSKIMKNGNTPEIEEEVDALLKKNTKNLEVRAFYSWYLKKTGRGVQSGLESTHNKETLTKYDSRDTYALISLANMYRTIAREIRPKNDEEAKKRKTSYHRAAQLFHKALVTDPKNAFAAQGIAIVFAEEKQPAQALEIFRRVRDAVDSFSVHLNLGHCLIELGQHAKAIQEYSIALARFSDESKDARTLALIGRAWFARGAQEKSLESYAKALEFSKKALAVAEQHHEKLVSQMKYNVAFVQFSIAQFLVRLDISKRTVEDITQASEGLKQAIDTFTALAEEKHAPVSPEILTQRASMGSKTLTTQLERILKEQEEYEVQFKAKIEEAKRIREVEKAKAEMEEQKRKKEQEEREKQKREEFEKLQEQAKAWEAEREALLAADPDDDEKPKRKKKNAVWTDEEASGDENGEKKTKKKRRSKKKVAEDGEAEPAKPKKRRLTKREEKYKSKEIIEDSDEELADYQDDALEAAEAKIDANGDDEKDDEEPEADAEPEQNGDAEEDLF